MASSTRIPPRTSPVKTWAVSAVSETSGTPLCEPLLGARPVQFLVGRHLADDVEEPPLALHLLRRAGLEDPEVLEGLVVASPPPLLALIVVVLAVLAERVGHRVGLGGLRQLDAPGHFHDAVVAVPGVRVRGRLELLREGFDVALGLS